MQWCHKAAWIEPTEDFSTLSLYKSPRTQLPCTKDKTQTTTKIVNNIPHKKIWKWNFIGKWHQYCMFCNFVLKKVVWIAFHAFQLHAFFYCAGKIPGKRQCPPIHCELSDKGARFMGLWQVADKLKVNRIWLHVEIRRWHCINSRK